jgi:hypothetical protein
MRNEFTAIVERHGRWLIAYCPEIPGANGQGKTKAEALKSLRDGDAREGHRRVKRGAGYLDGPIRPSSRRASG